MWGLGFRQARSSPCVFYHRALDARLVVHGDDLWLLADEPGLRQLMPQIDAAEGGLYDVKLEGVLGAGPEDAKSVRSLNRQIRLVQGVGLEEEAGPRHAESS